MRIRNKTQMYRLLASGQLGNHVPQYMSLSEWEPHSQENKYWGVRSLRSRGKFSALLTADEVRKDVERRDCGYNISPQQRDEKVLLNGELVEYPDIRLFYSTVPTHMRPSLRQGGREVRGLSVWCVLRSFLCSNSLEDIRELLDKYPGHVIEFSTYSIKVGVFPNRNTVIWEVRDY